MNIMKKILFAGLWFLFCVVEINAAKTDSVKVSVANVAVSVSGENLFVAMDIDVSELKLKRNRELLITPWIGNDNDTVVLKSVMIAGRNRYYHHLRNGLPEDVTLYRRGKIDTVEYRSMVPYESWMGGAELKLGEETCGCLSRVLAESDTSLAFIDGRPEEFVPCFVYLKPEAVDQKISVAKGSAYVDFPVNRTELHEDYRQNRAELSKIRATIDNLRNDADTRITSVFIKGYASPEGTYERNAYLAEKRTETLCRYVRDMYSFPDSILTMDFEPEDWEGLRLYVQNSWLEHRDGILAIIDGDMTPDDKDWKIRVQYPNDYRFLLGEVYPGLRHSDYAVTYEVRAYFDVEEIKQVMATSPQKLSLQELFLVAQNLEEGSDGYNETFEIAVRMFPDDPTANLNAANIAMSKGDMKNAGRYLDKAGDTPEAVYARAVYAAIEGDYAKAEPLFRQASDSGVEEAEEALNCVMELNGYAVVGEN